MNFKFICYLKSVEFQELTKILINQIGADQNMILNFQSNIEREDPVEFLNASNC